MGLVTNVLHISSRDTRGGAARATYRLHQGLQRVGIDSCIRVQSKASDDPKVIGPSSDIAKGWVKLRARLNKLPWSFYPDREQLPYSVQWLPSGTLSAISEYDMSADIIHLHWICGGFLSIGEIANLNEPLVWTLHDMWAFTGGCHYDQGCGRYVESCGACPLLHSAREWDLSRWMWRRKRKAWRNLALTLVTPSHWLASCARQSSLLKDKRIEVIPNGLDTERFKPIDKQVAREVLNLPLQRSLVLFGANNPENPLKGYELLKAALQDLTAINHADKVDLTIFGASQPKEHQLAWNLNTHYLGYFNDTPSLALVYSAADVMVVPSKQEAFGQTASEAMACGTPVVAFDATGLKDIVDHQQNGYLAQPFDTEDLAHGIQWVLENENRRQKLSQNARQKAVQEFDQELQARRYLDLYEDILVRRSNALSKVK
jgi:glycosyltransferase involved in cell wall biosynthesis